MSKLLIIDKNIHLSKIKNNILQNNSNLNLFIVDTKNQESLNSLIKLCQNIQYNSTIVISNNTDIISKVMNSNLICNYLIQSEKKQNIDTQYNNIYKKIKYIQKQIYQELFKIGYNLHYNGTKYLMETIYYIHYYKKYGTYKLEKEIYPILAKKHSKNISTIKSDITKATNKINYNSHEKELKKYFSYFLDNKIKPKLVINTILNKIEYNK